MKKTVLLAVAGLAALSLATACQDTAAPVEPAITPVFAVEFNDWYDVTFIFFNACFGEDMEFVGKVKQMQTVTEDGAGGFHVTRHRNWNGRVTGLTTGDQYQINFPVNWSRYFRGPFPETFNRIHRNNINRIGGPGTYFIYLKEHLTINANGEVVQDRSIIESICTA